MKVNSRIVPVAELSWSRRREMLRLMQRYYENVRETEFAADLSEKQWVIEISEPATGRLCGFSTQMTFAVAQPEGPPAIALFSGDTIVDEPYRQCNQLAGLWGRLALQLVEHHPGQSVSWFLISKGYKTYRFLPLFFHRFYPCCSEATPPHLASRLGAFAQCKFPTTYDPASGLIRGGPQGCRLRRGLADVTPARQRDPHVRYFCEQNPRHAWGDELCCIAPISRENFTPAAWRVIHSAEEAEPISTSPVSLALAGPPP